MQDFSTPWGPLSLGAPVSQDSSVGRTLSEGLLQAQAETQRDLEGARLLVLGDRQGYLALALVRQGALVTSWSDSALDQRCQLLNAEELDLNGEKLILCDALTLPGQDFGGALVRLEAPEERWVYQAQILSQALGPGGLVFAAAENRPGTREALERAFGPWEDETPLGPGTLYHFRGLQAPKVTGSLVQQGRLEALNLTWAAHVGVYGGGTLDGPTRLFLSRFPRPKTQVKTVIDLGCGRGLLGLAAARTFPDAVIFCVDESFLAVWSARESFRLSGLGHRGFFLTGDCLEDFDKGYADLILCHPPESQWRKMAEEAGRVLGNAGEFWILTEEAWGAAEVLRGIFRDCRLCAQGTSGQIWRCSR